MNGKKHQKKLILKIEDNCKNEMRELDYHKLFNF